MNTEDKTLLDKAKEYAKNFPDKNYRGIYLVEAYLAGAGENNGLKWVKASEPIEALKPQIDLIPEIAMRDIQRLAEIKGYSIEQVIAGWWIRFGEVQTLQIELDYRESLLRSGLSFIKASERLPEIPNPLPPDTIEERGVLLVNRTHSCGNFWYPSYGQPPTSLMNLQFDGWDISQWEWLDESGSSLPCIKCKEREKEVEGLRAKVEFYRTATDKVRELVSNSPDIGAPCQPLYDAIEDKLNENNSRIKELEEALRIEKEFWQWSFERSGWTLDSSGKYYYKSRDSDQLPKGKRCEVDEMKNKFLALKQTT